MDCKMINIGVALKKVKDPAIKERLLMVQSAQQQPLRAVAKTFGCAHGTIDYWKKRYEKQGVRGLYTKSRSGRPPKITREQNAEIKRVVRKHNIKQGWRTQHVRSIIVEKTGVRYSFRHTIRIIQNWGLSKIKPRPRYAFSKKDEREDFLKKTARTWHVNLQDG
ncbi:MAG: helix-turn-helix domain-containing protein [Candidatus Omnitrophota bacterium]